MNDLEKYISELVAMPDVLQTGKLMIPYYAAALEDPTLFENGYNLQNEHGVTVDVAIPVGGKRKGGILEIAFPQECAEQLAEFLRGKDGFPNARVAYDYRVMWGEEPPYTGQHRNRVAVVARGRHFGYSEKAIREGVRSHQHPRFEKHGFFLAYKRITGIDLELELETWKLRTAA